MADPVNFTIDGHQLKAPAGTLLINAAKEAGIAIPSFCYYDGLSLQAACRMCLVEIEKTPKLQVACTMPIAEGMVVHTDSEQVRKARKGMLEFLLTNHPLDCPVCDKGGECELQDMVFRYGAGESRYLETKVHVDEKQWSPIVFYDAPRCILCYRCVRICGEGLGVGALGIANRGAASEIVPNRGDHLECDECGACIDICPVGALTSGTYRYKTRPWEMEHVGTICTHCSNGCKTTMGVRNGEIIRCNNRDHSGVNGEFLCIKGRYAFDFNQNPERLTAPLVRTNGELRPTSWAIALATVAKKFSETKARNGRFGVIGSNHTTNEENYLLQKFARQALGTSNIDHHRTGDVTTLLDALHGKTAALATTADLYTTKAALVIHADLAQEQPLLAFQLRANYRHHKAQIYAITSGPVREDNYGTGVRAEYGNEFDALNSVRDRLAGETELVILFGAAIKGDEIRRLVAFGDSLGIPVKYVCLLDYSNSRGASDMGLLPDLLPGYSSVREIGLEPGLNYDQMLSAARRTRSDRSASDSRLGRRRCRRSRHDNPRSRRRRDPSTCGWCRRRRSRRRRIRSSHRPPESSAEPWCRDARRDRPPSQGLPRRARRGLRLPAKVSSFLNSSSVRGPAAGARLNSVRENCCHSTATLTRERTAAALLQINVVSQALPELLICRGSALVSAAISCGETLSGDRMRRILMGKTRSDRARLSIGTMPAHAVGDRHAFCLQGDEFPGLSNCTYDTYAQCMASASGRFLTCVGQSLLRRRIRRSLRLSKSRPAVPAAIRSGPARLLSALPLLTSARAIDTRERELTRAGWS